MLGIVTILVMIFNLVISLWNAYASGYNSVILEKTRNMKFRDFFSIANSFGLVLSFAGATYALSFFLSYLAYALGQINVDVVLLIASYSFIVLGGLIVFSGIVITIESILIAYLKRNFWSVLVAIYNTFASVWNIFVYISSFRYAKDIADKYGSDEDNRVKAIIIIIIAALIAIFLVYTFYKWGKNKAEKEIR